MLRSHFFYLLVLPGLADKAEQIDRVGEERERAVAQLVSLVALRVALTYPVQMVNPRQIG